MGALNNQIMKDKKSKVGRKNIKVTDVICFGSPRSFTQSQVLSIEETNIPIIQVINILDHITCLKSESTGKKFDWESLTHCSAHPIIDIEYKQKTVTTQYIKLKDKLFNDTICPMGSNRIYNIENGNCIFITDKKDIKQKKYDTLDSIMESLEKNETNILKKENEKLNKNKSLEINNQSCDLLDKAIDDVFKLIFQKFPMDIKRLEMYSNKVKAQEAILLLEEFLKEGRKLVELELKE